MLYVTIIVVAILVVVCILGYKYINDTHNPNLYNTEDNLFSINVIANSMYDRYLKYKEADDKEKYMYRIADDEIISFIENVIHISNQ